MAGAPTSTAFCPVAWRLTKPVDDGSVRVYSVRCVLERLDKPCGLSLGEYAAATETRARTAAMVNFIFG